MRRDTLYNVAIMDGKGRKKRTLRLIGGKMILNQEVILSKDTLPFKGRRYLVLSFEYDGTPRIKEV